MSCRVLERFRPFLQKNGGRWHNVSSQKSWLSTQDNPQIILWAVSLSFWASTGEWAARCQLSWFSRGNPILHLPASSVVHKVFTNFHNFPIQVLWICRARSQRMWAPLLSSWAVTLAQFSSLHVFFQDYCETVDYLGSSLDFSPSDISKTQQLAAEVSTWMKTTAGENM